MGSVLISCKGAAPFVYGINVITLAKPDTDTCIVTADTYGKKILLLFK